MPTTAQASRTRYGRAYRNRRRSVVRWRGTLASLIAMWMCAVPLPCRPHDRFEVGIARRPVQLGLRFVRRRIEDRRIAGPARTERPRHVSAGDARHRLDHLSHGMRMARAEVVRA